MFSFMTNGIFWMWAIAILLAIASGVFAHCAKGHCLWLHRLIIAMWTLGPPIFYLVDAQRRIMIDIAPSEVEKYFLDAATKFWAAVLLFLAGIYSSEKWLK